LAKEEFPFNFIIIYLLRMNLFLHINNGVRKVIVTLLFVFSCCISNVSANNFFEVTQVKVVKCYPNPATSVVNFDFPKNFDKAYTLQIYSFAGKQMVETPLSGNKVTITLTEFYRGIYVYQLRDKSGKIVDSGKFQVAK
jgi:hypothetical protein